MKTAYEILDELDNWFMEADLNQATQLWAILTALRGPDQPGLESLKTTTTAVIRAKALPKTFKYSHLTTAANSNYGLTIQEAINSIITPTVPQTHFTAHALWALEFLTGRAT